MNNQLGIFTVFDCKAKAYLQPFFSVNIETATREFTAAVNGEGNFNRFAEDYSLFELGVFEQLTGELVTYPAPQHLCNAVTLKTVQQFPMTNGDTRRSPEEAESDIARMRAITALEYPVKESK